MKELAIFAVILFLLPLANAFQLGIHCDGVELINEIGVEDFVSSCKEKGYSLILFNAMPWDYYFKSPTLQSLGWEYGGDLLAALINQSHGKGIKVYVDIQTLAWKLRDGYDNPGRIPDEKDVVNIVDELINYGVDGISEEMFPAEWMAGVYEKCNEYGLPYIHKHIPYDVAWFNEERSSVFRAYSNCSILMTEDYYMNDDLVRWEMAAGFAHSLNKNLWVKSCPEEWAVGSIENMENVLVLRTLQYNPQYVFAMIYSKDDFEEFQPKEVREIANNFSYDGNKPIFNIVVYLTNDKEDMDAWQLFDVGYPAIASAAEASGYTTYITNEPLENAAAYYIYTRGRMNTTLHLPSSILSLFNQSKPVFFEVAYDLPLSGEWGIIRNKVGINQKEFESLFGTWGVKGKYEGIEYYHLSDDWYLFNPIEPQDVYGNILSTGNFRGKEYAFVIKNNNFVFVNGAGLDEEASFPISNILNDALQQPFHGVANVGRTSIFYAYEEGILKIKFPYDVESIEYMKRNMKGEVETGKAVYSGEYKHYMEKGDLLILKLILNETFGINITKPRNHLYINDRGIVPLEKTVVIGKITIEMTALNIDSIDIYVNDELKYSGNETIWMFDEPAFGKYEIRAVGHHGSKECEDFVEAMMVNW